ncbi:MULTISPECIES: site-specific DNA-methyltransferase [unclassified Microbacterium]|uniref:DNA-methyltransferase n=1 Tax=unclassified Microbacterium TaxID=2609290 RepID=UPI00160534F0|nr:MULTISPECIES: site-specific DNA-methyltransferase [unclassified Microbacterium]QNA93644.1 site-specific DNA-methyltransferase [Microbacterium sp. Se63.02b]QYM63907.1 site-specific DNA-methyltransferase [Microbacterium sp. Se5.02b]
MAASGAVTPHPALGAVTIIEGDNLAVAATLPSGSFTLVYLDPPFNTGRTQERQVVTARRASAPHDEPAGSGTTPAESDAPTPVAADSAPPSGETEVRHGFHGHAYERVRGMLRAYDDRFDDYGAFLMPRLEEAWRLLADDGTLYLHLDYREAHYAKVMLDAVFGRDCFLNELIWAYDYGAKSRSRWPTKHDTILVYVKNPREYVFNSDEVDREPYMAPGLVTAEKAARGKLPTDVWWHTIVPTTGREKTGYPTQKPEGILRRIVTASSRPGDRVLDLFAGSGTAGAVASALGRDAVLVDDNPEAVRIMTARMPHAEATTLA